jgi:hypothetical protein
MVLVGCCSVVATGAITSRDINVGGAAMGRLSLGVKMIVWDKGGYAFLPCEKGQGPIHKEHGPPCILVSYYCQY